MCFILAYCILHMICIQIQPDDLVTSGFCSTGPLSALAMRKDIEASKHETKPVLEYEACLSFLGRSHCAHGNRVGPMPHAA